MGGEEGGLAEPFLVGMSLESSPWFQSDEEPSKEGRL